MDLNVKMIKNEVFEISDTMDILAQVIKRQDLMLQKQDARLALIELALIKSGAIDESAALRDQDPDLPEYPDIYTKAGTIKKVTNRYSQEYKRNIKADKMTKGSNRNEVLLGKEEEIDVGETRENFAHEGGEKIALDYPVSKGSYAHEGGESSKFVSDENDDCYKRMD